VSSPVGFGARISAEKRTTRDDEAMTSRIDVLWHSAQLRSAEHAVVERVGHGWVLSGSAALPVGESPGHLEYVVTVSEAWTVARADVSVWVGPTEMSLRLEHHDRTWTIDDRVRPDLDGCSDVDLGWTPLTNLVPIRRHDVAVGSSFEIVAAWLKFPELVVEPNRQRYTRLAADRWRYESGPYDFELLVDPSGVVLQYGDDLWHAAALMER
jgi:uncharacterized protein